ncbi:MAG: metal-dependent hydrolase [Candidatus Ranarchaeia archaeon]
MPVIKYLGHSSFLMSTKEHRLIFDPFITGNPHAPVSLDDLNVDYILVSHGHADHLGDTVKLAQMNNATVISTFELAEYLSTKGVKTHGQHIGGAFIHPFGKVKLTIAVHGNAVPDADGSLLAVGGPPCGFLVTAEGKTLYHPGDTGLFYDMKLIGELNSIDVALLPIGDNYTMGVSDAVKAAEFLKAKIFVPMHYDTFPVIQADPNKFINELEKINLKGVILKAGEEISF